MRRVVVTGMGIVSSIGNNTQEVLASLREAKSGITRAEDQVKLGFRSQVAGAPTLDPAAIVDHDDAVERDVQHRGAQGIVAAQLDRSPQPEHAGAKPVAGAGGLEQAVQGFFGFDNLVFC